MTQRQAWSLTGVAPEVRELARAAAQGEGISVGEWLRRRILAENENADAGSAIPKPRLVTKGYEERDHFGDASSASGDPDTDLATRRIDEAVQAMASLLENNVRSQNDAKRAMSSFASEIKSAARDQASAFNELNERIDRVERNAGAGELRNSVQALGQNVSQLSHQAGNNLKEVRGQVGTLAESLKALTGKIATGREDSNRLGLFVQEQLSTFAERVRSAESRTANLSKVEQTVGTLGNRVAQLAGVEKSLAELGERDARTMRKIDAVAGNMGTLANQMASTREENDQIVGRLKAAEARMALYARVEIAVDALSNRIAGLGLIERSIAELNERDTEGMRSVNALAGNLETLSGQVIAARQNSDQIAERLRTAEGEIAHYSQVEDAVEMLRKRVIALGQIEKSIGQLSARDAETLRQVDALAGNLESLVGKVSAARNESNGLAERMQSTEGRMARYSEIEDTVEMLRKRIAALGQLEESVGELSNRDVEAMRQLSSVREDTDRLVARMRSAEERIADYAKAEDAVATVKKRLASLNDIEKSVADLDKDGKEAQRKIDLLIPNLDLLAANLDLLADKFSATHEDTDRLAQRMNFAESRFSEVAASVESLNERVQGLDRFEKTAANLGKQSTETAREVHALTGDVKSLASQISSARDEAQQIAQRLQAAEAALGDAGKVDESVDTLKKRIGAIAAIEKSVADLSERDVEAARQVDSLAADLESLTGKIATAEAEHTYLAERVQSGDARASRMEDKVETLGKRVAQISSLEKTISELAQGTGDGARQIEALAANLASLSAPVSITSEESNRLSEVEKAITNLGQGNTVAARKIDGLASNVQSLVDTVASVRQDFASLGERLNADGQMAAPQSDDARRPTPSVEAKLESLFARVTENELRRSEAEAAAEARISNLEALLADSENTSHQILTELRSGLSAMATRLAAMEERERAFPGATMLAALEPAAPAFVPAHTAEDVLNQSASISLRQTAPESDADSMLESEAWRPESETATAEELPFALFENEPPPVADAELPPTQENFEPSADQETPAAEQSYLAQARRAALANALTDDASKKPDREQRSLFARPAILVPSAIVLAAAGYLAVTSMMSPAPQPADQLNASQSNPQASEGAVPTGDPSSSPSNANAPRAASYASLDEALAQANMGDAKAMLLLGVAYADGNGVTQNDAEAATWLRRAAEQGEAMAQYRLGVRLERGIGLPKDMTEATHWYAEAAQKGNVRAMYNLGVAYANGSGVDRNAGEALRWFASAAELGLTDAQFNLAVMYERGMGVTASLSEAYTWYAIALAGGDMESKSRVEALATQLPVVEKEAADQAVVAFVPKPIVAQANELPQLQPIGTR